MASVAAEMAEHYLLAAIVASILAFLFLAGIRGRKAARGRKRTDDGDPFAAGKEQYHSDTDGCGVPDVIVVGAGVAGSALAYTLGKDGRRVHVIERDLSEPDRIVGELLQPGGYLKLVELGLQETKISLYIQLFSVRLEQGTVTSLLEENGTIKGVLYKNKAGEELKAFAPLTIVCDGCFSNLRKSLCSPKV
ncbi:hypothetical protein BHE74_00003641 [Ensete ventricosum]|nr:hypothetical protein GW17_00024595 [Ensete ventricosum]RWW87532.1 hypothetical protein BHE74_00003641 [Ensete ventricosum]